MDRQTKTKKGMNIQQKTRAKVAGLINDLHLLQSLPGLTNDVAKTYRLGHQFMKYMRELDIIDTRNKTVVYLNPKNHSTEYILDYVMSRYEAEYSKVIETATADMVNLEVELPAHMKWIAQEAIYKNEIRHLQSDLNRSEARIATLEFAIRKKDQEIAELSNKKSIFARIKTLFQ